jgi:hypothetical protein
MKAEYIEGQKARKNFERFACSTSSSEGIAKLGDRAYELLQKWGRFQVVQDRKQADLIFLLSAREYNGGYITSGGALRAELNENGTINTSSNPT